MHGDAEGLGRRRTRKGTEVVIDGSLTSSRRPDDLPAYCEAIVNEFAKTPAGGLAR